jgi:hypothetical protein
MMGELTMEQIEWVGDVVALSMCVMTVLWLLKDRSGSHCRVMIPGVGGMMRSFRQEFRHRIGAGDGPMRTVDDLEARQVRPERMVCNEAPVASIGFTSIQEGVDSRERGADETALPPEDRYQEAKRLAAMGLCKEKILEQVGLPKGELEFLLKVNQLRSGLVEAPAAGTPGAV